MTARPRSAVQVGICQLVYASHIGLYPSVRVWNIQPDGTPLAFTGFPLEARDPMTFRAHVAAYQTPWPDQSLPELVLDHGSLPGFSGSPVFLPNGKVVASLIRDGKPEAPGIAIARPVSVLRKMPEEMPRAAKLVAEGESLRGRDNSETAVEAHAATVTAGVWEVVNTTGAGSQNATLVRFLQDVVVGVPLQ